MLKPIKDCTPEFCYKAGESVTTEGQCSHALGFGGENVVTANGGESWAIGFEPLAKVMTKGVYGVSIAAKFDSMAIADGKYGLAFTNHPKGFVQAGVDGILMIRWYDELAGRWRIKIGYVGEDGIEAHKLYRIDDMGEFELVLV